MRLRPRLLVICGSGPPPGCSTVVVVGHFTFIHFYFTSWIILLSMGLTDDGVTIHQFTLLILAFYAHDWGALCHGGSESAATLRPVLWCLESRLRACKRAWLAPILRRTTTSFLFWDQCVGASNRPLDAGGRIYIGRYIHTYVYCTYIPDLLNSRGLISSLSLYWKKWV